MSQDEPKKYPFFAEERCSDTFLFNFHRQASLVVDCEACGRTHFCGNSVVEGYEEGELENLDRKQEKEPERYICSDDGDMISWALYNGKQFVFLCPCNYARALEDLLWKNSSRIMSYFVARAQEEADEAKRKNEQVKAANDAPVRTKLL